MNENSLFWKAFERNPFGAMLALTMPFGMAVALLMAIITAPKNSAEKGNSVR